MAGFFVLGACVAVIGESGGAADQEDTSASDLADLISSGETSMPATQGEFLSAVGTGQEAAADGNELQIVEARMARAEAICTVLGDRLRVENWVGVVESVETTMGGDGGVISIEIAEDVLVQTWNNGLSDIGTGSLIDPETEVWDQVVDLSEGDEVLFTGRFDDASDCISESSLMDRSGMETPAFIFIFSEVQSAPQ